MNDDGDRRLGRVINYSQDKGFGFIVDEDDGERVFVHNTQIRGAGFRYLVRGENVEFRRRRNEERGRLDAIDVAAARGRLHGTVVDFNHDRGFGRISPGDGAGRPLFFHYSDILWDRPGKSSARSGDQVEYDLIEGRKGAQAGRVKLLDARPPLLRFAWMGRDEQWLPKLAGRAEPELWRPNASRDNSEYPILRSYILHTFARLEEEDRTEGMKGRKIAVGQEDSRPFACFNTGLVTPNQEPIFALFKGKSPDRDGCSWQLSGFHSESDHEVLGKFDELPELADYFDDPSVLLYDRRCKLMINTDHIIDERLDRFPQVLRDNKHLAIQALNSARASTEQRVYRNYKAAVPQFHRGKVQLLLPLCLEHPRRADLALVVSREGQQYIGSTTLTLEMAYSNARLLCRPDTEWLQP